MQPAVPLNEWKLSVNGLVARPVAFSWDDFNALPQVEDVSDFHCVTTWSKYECRWGGVAFTTLYEHVQPAPEAQYVYFTSFDGYSTNVPLARCLDDDVLIATQFDGAPLPREHGGPARVIIPKLYAWKGAKFVSGISFLAEDKLGFWEVRGYSEHCGSLEGRAVRLNSETRLLRSTCLPGHRIRSLNLSRSPRRIRRPKRTPWRDRMKCRDQFGRCNFHVAHERFDITALSKICEVRRTVRAALLDEVRHRNRTSQQKGVFNKCLSSSPGWS